jgi:hypothetical protein
MNLSGHSKKAHLIHSDVPGAPFRIGEAVMVISATDETCDAQRIGMRGTVLFFEYSCGCGQTYPEDPMIGVKFADGTREEFWREELVSTDSAPTTARNTSGGSRSPKGSPLLNANDPNRAI